MPYVPNQQDPNQQNPLGQQAPMTTTAPGAGPAAGGKPSSATPNSNQPTQPFANLSAYLTANAPQISQEANTIAGQLGSQYGQVQGDINTGNQNFQNQVTGGYNAPNPTLLSNAAANPASFVQDQNNVKAFQGLFNNPYGGPQNFEGTQPYQALNAEVNNAVQQANLVNSFPGLQTYLQQTGTNNPTPGDTLLDTALISSSPSAYQTVTTAAQPFTKLSGNLANAVTQNDQAVQQAIQNAGQTQADARTALATAQGNEAQNLTNEQNTIQGIVNAYNQSVGTINPVVSDISTAIQNYLAQNQNLNAPGIGNALAPFQGLSPIGMPGEATYASPQDYATIAALGTLGDQNLSQLPITSSTANQAQTFQLPQNLQNALGQAPGVENALQTEINNIGQAIQTTGGANSVQQYLGAQSDQSTAQNSYNALQPQLQSAHQALQQANLLIGRGGQPANPYDPNKQPQQYQQAQSLIDNYNSLNQQASALTTQIQNDQQTINSIAQNLSWLQGAESGYQGLVNTINTDLAKLGQVNAPTLTYTPTAPVDPVTGAVINPVTAGNIAGTTAGATAGSNALLQAAMQGFQDIPAASGAAGVGTGTYGGVSYADAMNALNPDTAIVGGQPVPVSPGLSPVSAALPAALEAYGTSNIVQNEAANPIKGGIQTLGNQGLTLAAMSFPPQVFQGIENQVSNILSDIGSFFGGIF